MWRQLAVWIQVLRLHIEAAVSSGRELDAVAADAVGTWGTACAAVIRGCRVACIGCTRIKTRRGRCDLFHHLALLLHLQTRPGR